MCIQMADIQWWVSDNESPAMYAKLWTPKQFYLQNSYN